MGNNEYRIIGSILLVLCQSHQVQANTNNHIRGHNQWTLTVSIPCSVCSFAKMRATVTWCLSTRPNTAGILNMENVMRCQQNVKFEPICVKSTLRTGQSTHPQKTINMRGQDSLNQLIFWSTIANWAHFKLHNRKKCQDQTKSSSKPDTQYWICSARQSNLCHEFRIFEWML